MAGARQRRSTLRGVWLLTAASVCYAAAMAGVLYFDSWLFQMACGLLKGAWIGILFVIGHDACHGSLTPHRWLNHLLGRLAFLPSLHPYSSWEYAHNRVHHAWTNLRGKDVAWAPFSKEEFDNLSPLRRGMERIYRTVYGLGLNYLVEYWWRHMLFPDREARQSMVNRTFLFDRLIVFAFAALELAGLTAYWIYSSDTGAQWPVLASWVAWGVVVPFLLWNWLMGFAIFQHHNHPSVAWYMDREQWDFYRGQVQGTVHVVLPWGLGRFFHQIMEHTAHHANPKIPLYHLNECQDSLERAFPEDITIEVWTLGNFLRTLARCKLYDYHNHRWTNFAGKPTSWPIHERN